MNSFIRKFFIGEWNLGICNQDFIQELDKTPQGGSIKLRPVWMKHKRASSFIADPFIYKVRKDSVDILAEEFIFPIDKGVISLFTIDRFTGKNTSYKQVLEETCHLSYPFYDEETKRLIPESFANGNWASYSFEGGEAFDKQILANEPLIDATPIQWNGRWYVFCVKQPKALDQLLIYSSEHRDGTFVPHPLNPIKDDIRTSRCGGKCFIFKGSLYRIVQNSTSRYGECMHVMKVKDLSETTFCEELYCDIIIEDADRYPLGAHTLNFYDDFIVIDGYREVFRPLFAVYIYKLIPVLRKLHIHK